jgi:hypothetical protein
MPVENRSDFVSLFAGDVSPVQILAGSQLFVSAIESLDMFLQQANLFFQLCCFHFNPSHFFPESGPGL